MKFFDKLFRAIGFEEEEIEEEQDISLNKNKTKVKKKEVIIPNAKFNLKEKPKEIKTFYPQSQEEVEELVNIFKNNEDIIINIDKFVDEDKTRVLDFLFGAAFALEGELKKKDNDLYLMVHNEN